MMSFVSFPSVKLPYSKEQLMNEYIIFLRKGKEMLLNSLKKNAKHRQWISKKRPSFFWVPGRDPDRAGLYDLDKIGETYNVIYRNDETILFHGCHVLIENFKSSEYFGRFFFNFARCTVDNFIWDNAATYIFVDTWDGFKNVAFDPKKVTPDDHLCFHNKDFIEKLSAGMDSSASTYVESSIRNGNWDRVNGTPSRTATNPNEKDAKNSLLSSYFKVHI